MAQEDWVVYWAVGLFASAAVNVVKMCSNKVSEVEEAKQDLVKKSLHVIKDSFEKDESYNLLRKQQDYLTSQTITSTQDKIKAMHAKKGLIETQMDILGSKQALAMQTKEFMKTTKNVNNSSKVMNTLNTINSVGNAISV